jgi:hypothetical protein
MLDNYIVTLAGFWAITKCFIIPVVATIVIALLVLEHANKNRTQCASEGKTT